MPHYGTFSIGDFSHEKASYSFFSGDITAVSIAGFLTQFGALRTATEDIILGVLQKEKWVGDDTILSQAFPTNVFAQRELKALITYQGDTTLKKFQLEIPTFDPTGRMIAATDDIDLTETDMAAWVTAFEAIGRSPDDDTETVTVLFGKLVGRNL